MLFHSIMKQYMIQHLERDGNMVISVSCFIGAGDILLNKLSKTIISVCSGNGISLGLVGFGQYVAVKVI